eukprot:Seg2716.1 transcript_id=Seg2716.1/GoldUCD/mRNA.D3Y31 product="putative protein C4orf45-like" protein_id=Seg2716.1/GoldUCD/D3Y31
MALAVVGDYPFKRKYKDPRPLGKGHVVFTGPDGNKDHKTTILVPTYVGQVPAPKEHTGELYYIWRGARTTPHPRPRGFKVGEVGWHAKFMDRRNLESGHQITLGEFRQALEDRYTHRYQNPWYPLGGRPQSEQRSRQGSMIDYMERFRPATSSKRCRCLDRPSNIVPLPTVGSNRSRSSSYSSSLR